MIKYIIEKKETNYHAGLKARVDIEKILKDLNVTFIEEKKYVNKYLSDLVNLVRFSIKQKEILFFQYPNAKYIHILVKIVRKKRNVKTFCIIHDILGIRFKDKKLLQSEKNIFNKIDYIVSHNSKMTTELLKMGIKEEKIYNLEIFDYLLENKILIKKEKKADICFAGNLEKSPFIYKFDKSFKNIKIDVFGINYDKNKNKDNFNYKGAFPPDIIHEKLTGKYGLIWDGDSLETCSGNMGEYMKYNNPHKLSLYIAAGIPVITWKEAAIAEFIEKNNIGIAVSSLKELEDYFKKLKDIDYEEQIKNVLKIREKIIEGEIFKKIFGEISEKLKK